VALIGLLRQYIPQVRDFVAGLFHRVAVADGDRVVGGGLAVNGEKEQRPRRTVRWQNPSGQNRLTNQGDVFIMAVLLMGFNIRQL
jgi:hypothetical protein